MIVPASYTRWIASRHSLEVQYGCAGVRFFTPEDLEEAQVGYSIHPDGSSLCSDAKGLWKPSWIVIGYETGSGDPIFIDCLQPEPPVLAANHGEGSWKPELIASSLPTLSLILDEYSAMAEFRAHREEIEEDSPEASAFIERIKVIDPGPLRVEFWLSMLAY